MAPHASNSSLGRVGAPAAGRLAAAFAWRWCVGLAFWLVLSAPRGGSSGLSIGSFAWPDVLAGAVAAVAGAWASVVLMPPGRQRVHAVAVARFAIRSAVSSVAAGADVAWRALRPSLPLRPGFVTHRSALPAPMSRQVFVSVTALLPGTLPVRQDADGTVEYHCLDRTAPVADALAEDERRFAQCLDGCSPHGYASP